MKRALILPWLVVAACSSSLPTRYVIERDLGLQARLNLLGVDSGAPLGEAEELRRALFAYQSAREDLEPSGEPDDATRSTADDEHQQVVG